MKRVKVVRVLKNAPARLRQVAGRGVTALKGAKKSSVLAVAVLLCGVVLSGYALAQDGAPTSITHSKSDKRNISSRQQQGAGGTPGVKVQDTSEDGDNPTAGPRSARPDETQHHQAREDRVKDRIASAIEKGIITADQAKELTAKVDELAAKREEMSTMASDQRRSLRQELRKQTEQWARQNNLPTLFLKGVL